MMEDFPSRMSVLYERVLHKQKSQFAVKDEAVQRAIQNLKNAYLPNKNWQNLQQVLIANYDDAAHRCAYLHKYALCYTGMVHSLLHDAVATSDVPMVFLGDKEHISLCSLGGGPGTDAIAIIDVFYQWFNFSYCSVRVIDYLEQWEYVFSSVINELQTGSYGEIEDAVLPEHFKYQYIQANLLEEFSPNVKQAIMDSDFVSMVKFISAAACCGTRKMVLEIFNCMQPGAFLLYIDNAAGGFLKMVQNVAQQCDMLSVFGPVEHFEYSNENYCVERYGYVSQLKTKVSIQIWIKPPYLPQAEHRIETFPYQKTFSQPPSPVDFQLPIHQSSLGKNHQVNRPIISEPIRTQTTVRTLERNDNLQHENNTTSQSREDDNLACCIIL